MSNMDFLYLTLTRPKLTVCDESHRRGLSLIFLCTLLTAFSLQCYPTSDQ